MAREATRSRSDSSDLTRQGDPALSAELARLHGRRTWDVAAAVVDLAAEPVTRVAVLGDGQAERPFEIGSITKALTGMLLAEAIGHGELTLATSVADILPDHRLTRFGSVTMKELCTHTSGLPGLPRHPSTSIGVLRFGLFGTDPYNNSRASLLLRLASRQQLRGRGIYTYSNLGGAVLGQLLAVAAGTDYASLLRERLFRPLRMSASTISRPGHTAPPGWSSRGRRPQPWVMGGYAPAGGVISTISDMGRLATSLLDGSAPGRASLTVLDDVPTAAPQRMAGMFWMIDPDPGTGRTVIWHNGQTGGYSAHLALYPQTHRAVIVLANVARADELRRLALSLRASFDPPIAA